MTRREAVVCASFCAKLNRQSSYRSKTNTDVCALQGESSYKRGPFEVSRLESDHIQEATKKSVWRKKHHVYSPMLFQLSYSECPDRIDR